MRDLRRFNRWYGGAGVYRRLLQRMAPDRDAPLTVADIATGNAAIFEMVRRWRRLRAIGVDFKIDHLLNSRAQAQLVAANALQLPFRDGAVDVVTSAHFFHHLTPDQNVDMLREALRVSRRGVIINDTRRHIVPYLVVRLISVLHLVGRITRNDAPASIRRGYAPDEVREIAKRVPARRFEVVRAWPFRFGLLLWK